MSALPPPAFASAAPEAHVDELAPETPPRACDVCGEHVPSDDDDDGPAVAGCGLYVWTRGEEIRHEEVPLCAACAAALGLTALARWEIDEEEG